jgi:hypothetical protein
VRVNETFLNVIKFNFKNCVRNSSLKIFTKKKLESIVEVDVFLCYKSKGKQSARHLAINVSADNRLDLHYPCYAPILFGYLKTLSSFFSNHFIFTYSLIKLCFIWFLISLSDSVWILPIPLHFANLSQTSLFLSFSYSILTLSFYFRLFNCFIF